MAALRNPSRLWIAFAGFAFSASIAIGLSSGCGDSGPRLNPTGGGGSAGAAATTTTTFADKGEDLFHAMEDELFDVCGVCHDAGGIADTPFLAGPDRYKSITSWPGIVMPDPEDSLFLTYAVTNGGHSGANLDAPEHKDTLLPKVTAWLTAESKAIGETPPEQVGKTLVPFAPILGFNAVYLNDLGKEFEGIAITFNANELTPNTLELKNIEIQTTVKMGVHFVHPLFSVYPKGAEPDPDPADSFSNLDEYIDANSSGLLGPGTLVLSNWVPEGKLGISFETIEPYSTTMGDGGTDGGPTSGCQDLTSFQDNAQGPFGNCTGCHGGANGQATSAVDMTGLTNGDAAAACAQILNRVDPADPPSSQIFVTTDPNGNAAHPFKFGGNATAYNNFKSAVSVWIAAEN